MPGGPGASRFALLIALLADFAADNASDRSAGTTSDRALVLKNGSSHGAGARDVDDGGLLILLRHAGTSTEA